MSLILEALRKLEREKPQQTRHTTVLLAPIARPQTKRGRWQGLALLCALAAGVALGAWLLLRAPAGPRLVATTSSPAPAPSSAPVAAIVPNTPAPTPAVRLPQPSATTKRPAPQTPQQPAATPRAFRLTAIGDQEGVAVAVLNDRLVRVGDLLQGARVARIGEDQVELVDDADGHHFTVGF